MSAVIANLHKNITAPLNCLGEYLDTLRSSFLSGRLARNCLNFGWIVDQNDTQTISRVYAAATIVARADSGCQTRETHFLAGFSLVLGCYYALL